MNAAETIRSMRELLIPHHDEIEEKWDVELEFEGDLASCHTSHQYVNFLNEENINHFPFGGKRLGQPGGKAPNSPDMSPIELINHDWQMAVLKRKPMTANALMKYANEEWSKISLRKVRGKIERMVKVYPWVARHSGNLYYEP